MEKFIHHLKRFTELQSKLWQALQDSLPAPTDHLLLNIPRSGNLVHNSKSWRYQRHGGGILFSEDPGKIKIDFHKVSQGEDAFDAWGLSSYFRALGPEGRKVLQSAGYQEGPYDRHLAPLLEQLVRDKILREKNQFYRFIEPKI